MCGSFGLGILNNYGHRCGRINDLQVLNRLINSISPQIYISYIISKLHLPYNIVVELVHTKAITGVLTYTFQSQMLMVHPHPYYP